MIVDDHDADGTGGGFAATVSADDRDAGAVTVDRSDVDLAVEPVDLTRHWELFSEMTQNMGTLFRQEVELAKTEAKEEAAAAGKASAMLVVAGVAVLALAFLSAGWRGCSTT